MKKINFKQIDLLRKRREEDNFANPFFIETKKYIKKGKKTIKSYRTLKLACPYKRVVLYKHVGWAL